MRALRILAAALLASQAVAHMQLHFPPPFQRLEQSAPHHWRRPVPPVTYYFQWLQEATRLTIARYPYDCCGPYDRWEYPCRGYVPLLGTPQGATTATWRAGSVATWNVSGIGNHYGGSCQVGSSIDKGENPVRARPQLLTPCSGATFRSAASYEGDCPHRNNGDWPEGQDFQFTVPQTCRSASPLSSLGYGTTGSRS